MAQAFVYSGRMMTGEKIKGGINAETYDLALETLRERGVYVTSLKTDRALKASWRPGFLQPDYGEAVSMFARHLATYQRSGIPLLKALQLIKVGKPGSSIQKAIQQVRLRVSEGKSLSQAMSEHGRIFSEVFINAVEAGETSGQLDEILDQTAETLERDNELKRQIKASLRYPLIVMIAIALAITVIVTFVVPRFAAFYGKFGSELPLPTQIVVGISDIFRNYWHLSILGLFTMGGILRRIYMTRWGRHFWDSISLRAPIFGVLIVKAATARFAILLKTMFHAGIPIVRALSILERSQSNTILRAEVERMREAFEAGREIEITPQKLNTGEVSQKRHLPEMAYNMLSSGLETGSLEMMLGELGKHYSREVDHSSKALASLIEPIMTVAIAGVVLLLALAIFLPMWNLIKVFQ